jgi:hypothetical protein
MLDLGPMYDRIIASRLPDWDKEAVAASMEKAIDTWMETDIKGEIVAAELTGTDPFPYKIDLTLADNGVLTVADWKTKRNGKLDDRWEMRETRSPQRKLYAAAALTLFGDRITWPLKFQIRGVLLAEDVRDVKTKTLTFHIAHAEAVEAVRHMRDLTAMRAVLIEREKYPWPRYESGCQMYGPAYKCEFEPYCWEGLTVPATDSERIDRTFSHSSSGEFMRCPERYRLLKSLPRVEADPDEEDTSAAGAGVVFHSVMEAIYTQIKANRPPITPDPTT